MARQVHEHDHAHEQDHEHDHEPLDDEVRAERERDLRRQVALAQIRQYGDPALRIRAGEVDVFDDELKSVTERMTRLMHDAEGIGLAANQVGIVRRFFVFHHDDADHVLVNPTIVSARGERETDDEGCLSLGPVRVPVERHLEVEIEGQDVNGDVVRFALDGIGARCVQHELDHLDGVLTIDRTDDESRRNALRLLRPRLQLR